VHYYNSTRTADKPGVDAGGLDSAQAAWAASGRDHVFAWFTSSSQGNTETRTVYLTEHCRRKI